MRAKLSPTAQPQLPPAGRSWPMPIRVRPSADDDVPQNFSLSFAAGCPEFPSSPNFPISNRQWLARLENAATHRKQTSEVDSNRHFWEGYCAPARARISRFGGLALDSTPYTSRSRNHRNSFKTLARAHFYYVQMDAPFASALLVIPAGGRDLARRGISPRSAVLIVAIALRNRIQPSENKGCA
jgi:hypothetical protein